MKKRRIFVLICTALVLIFGSVPGFAQENGFNEDFSDPTLPEWEHSQDITVQDGVLRINPGNLAFRTGFWTDITLQFEVMYEEPAELVVNYYAGDQGSYHLHIVPDGMFLIRGQAEAGEQELAQFGAYLFPQKEWVRLDITVKDGNHTVNVNGETILTASEETPLPGGAIGFMVHGEKAADFRNLSLRGSEAAGPMMGEEPQENPPGEEPPPGEEAPLGEEPPPAEGNLPAAEPLSETPQAAVPAEKSTLLETLFTQQSNPLEMQTLLINLALSAVLAFILGRVYIHWGASLSNRRKFAANFMLMTVTTTFIILVVRSSVALSLGLVGALSIVRFRAAVKEPEELAYLFLAIGLGIGLGDNQRLITMVAFAVAIVVLGLLHVFRRGEADVNLHLNLITNAGKELTLQTIMDVLKADCDKVKLLRFDEQDTTLEVSFLIELKDVNQLNQMRSSLKEIDPSMQISFLDNKGIW